MLFALLAWQVCLPASAQSMLCEHQFGYSSSNINSGILAIESAGNNIMAVGYQTNNNAIQNSLISNIKSNCDTAWSKINQSTLGNGSSAIIKALDGNYIVVGGEFLPNNKSKVSLLAFDTTGNKLWQKLHDFQGLHSGVAIRQLSDSSYFIVGSNTYEKPVFFVMRTDKAGNLLWKKNLTVIYNQTNPNWYVSVSGLLLTKDNNLLVFGDANTNVSSDAAFVYKLNTNGDSLHFQTLNISPRHDRFFEKKKMIQTADGGYIALINSLSLTNQSHPDSVAVEHAVKLDSSFNITGFYKHPVTPGKTFSFTTVGELSDSTVVTLMSGRYGVADSAFSILHLNSRGQLIKIDTFFSAISPKVHLSQGVIVNDSTVFVAGLCYTNSFFSNSYAAKVSFKNQAVGVANALPESVVAVYPNPVSNTVSITLPEHVQQAELQLINSSGQQVLTRKLKAASTEADLSQLPPGLYFYRIFTEKGVKTGKLVKE